jgi:Cas3 C-terminal domain
LDGGSLSRPDCRTIIERTIPIRGGSWYRVWRGRPDAGSQPPGSWSKNSYLRDLVLLPHDVRTAGLVTPANVGGRTFLLDKELGLRADV